MSLEQQIYIRLRGEIRGPFTADKLKELARRYQFGRHYEVSFDKEDWETALDHPELLPVAKDFSSRIRRLKQSPAQHGEVAKASPSATPELQPMRTDRRTAPPEGLTPLPEELPPLQDELPPLQQELPLLSEGLTPLAGATEGGEGESWYYSHGGKEQGPVTLEHLKLLASQGALCYDDPVWRQGMTNWTDAYRLAELFPERALAGLDGSSRTKPQSPFAEGGAGAFAVPTRAGQSGATTAASPLPVVSLVCALLGLGPCLVLGSILAVVAGHIGLRQIARGQPVMGGRGVAIAGVVVGYVTIGVWVLFLLGMIIAAFTRGAA